MTDIAISIAPEFEVAGVAVTLGIVEAEVVVERENPALSVAMDTLVQGLAEALGSLAPAEVEEIAATRRAYKALGKDPSRYRPSAEALSRRILQGKGLFRVNNVVDVNNLISLQSGFCVGTYDVARLQPPVVLRAGAEGETYEAIGRGPLNLHNLPLLADETGPFGSPTSDSERSMIRQETGQVLMVLYDFAGHGILQGALDFAAMTLETHCRAQRIRQRILGPA